MGRVKAVMVEQEVLTTQRTEDFMINTRYWTSWLSEESGLWGGANKVNEVWKGEMGAQTRGVGQ